MKRDQYQLRFPPLRFLQSVGRCRLKSPGQGHYRQRRRSILLERVIVNLIENDIMSSASEISPKGRRDLDVCVLNGHIKATQVIPLEASFPTSIRC